MRDYRDAKAMARTLRASLAAKGHNISVAESLELTAKQLGFADWNTLAAAIKAAETEKPAEAAPAPPPSAAVAPPPDPSPAVETPGRRRGTYFSGELEKTLHRAVALTQERQHGYTTLEHLLLALTDDPETTPVLEACQVDIGVLKARALRYVDGELTSLKTMGDPANSAPTAGFHRVVQRATIHVQSSGRGVVTGANLLVAIFSERESHACMFLETQGLTRYDAVNFIAHGVRKGGPAA